MRLEQVQGLACLGTAAKRAWLQPAGAPVSKEMVVVACVPVSGTCVRVETQRLQTEDRQDETSSATPAVESLPAKVWGSTSSGDAAWQGSGGPHGRCASRLAVGAVLK